MSSTALQVVSDSSDPRLPAVADKRALQSYIERLEDPELLALQNRLAAAYDKACQALVGENDIQREGGKTFKRKSAWKKLARYFGISTAVLAQDERFLVDASTGESVFIASCTVRATSPWGQAADATGACSTDEETGRRKITIADAIATAETRASNRATSNLIAMGEVSAEETSREDRENVVRKSFEEMTLDEAKTVVYPWRNPEKHRDKPLSTLSFSMLNTVLEAIVAEIVKSGETPRRLEVKRATELLLADQSRPATVDQTTRIRELLTVADLTDEGKSAVEKQISDIEKPLVIGVANAVIAKLEGLVPKQATAAAQEASSSEAGEARSQSQPASVSATPPVSEPAAPATAPTTPKTAAAAKPTADAKADEPAFGKGARPWNTQGGSDLGF